MTARAHRRAPTRIGVAAASLATCLALPGAAAAHGLSGRADLPVPVGMFYWAAAATLLVSFVLLAVGWTTPRVGRHRSRPLPRLTRLLRTPGLRLAAQLASLLLFLVGTASAFLGGEARPDQVMAPVLVFVILWVGMVPIQAIFGDVWGAIHPMRPLARLVGAPEYATGRMPPRWGVHLATAGIIAFTWLELVYPTVSNLPLLGTLMVAWAVLTVAGMRWAGIETWLARGEPFAVYLGLLARIAPLGPPAPSAGAPRAADHHQEATSSAPLQLRAPFVGAAALRPPLGIVALLGAMIGSISYDGFSETPWFTRQLSIWLAEAQGRGLDVELTRLGIRSLWFVAFILAAALLLAGFGELCGRLGRLRRLPGATHPGSMAHSLLPIVVGYVIAHYFSYLVFQGQLFLSRLSDPFGRGWDLFGTAGMGVDYTVVGPETIWYVQVVSIVGAHVVALALAHDRALELAGERSRVTLSQVPMLILMLCFTLAGMWFLSEGLS